MNPTHKTLMCVPAIMLALSGCAQNTMMKDEGMAKDGMMKKDDAMMKKDSMCADMMKK